MRKRLRIEDVLLREHASGERFGRIAGKDRHGRLGDDRAGIEFRHHEMHRAAVEKHAFRERPLVGVGAPEKREEGRVDVEHPALPSRSTKPGRQNPHEAGKADEVDAAPAQRLVDDRLEALPIGEGLVIDADSVDARPRAPCARPPAPGRFDRTSAISAG